MKHDYSAFHTDDCIREVLSFVQRPVTGERSLADRFDIPVANVFDFFVGPYFVIPQTYAALDEELQVRIYRAALMRAAALSMGQQDVVLTPTGLGIVSTQSMAPASSERRAELVRSLFQSSDHLFVRALRELARADGWLDSEPGRFWSRTPVHSLDMRETLDEFIEGQPDRAELFDSMTHRVLGVPLAEAVASADLVPDSPTWLISLQALVCNYIRRIARADYRKGAQVSAHHDIASHLHAVREAHDLWSRGEAFALWNDTPLDRYRNRRESSGFFF